MSSARQYAAQTYPSPQSAVTASSVNYSQYGGSQFSPSRPAMPLSNSFGASSSRMNGASSSSSNRPGGGGGGGGSSGLKPPGDKRVESRDVARVHWRALKRFLAAWLERESPSSRASAREKLTRLTKLQFQELSTDVYDELMRRLAAERGEIEGDVPFLPVREDFHPKRNQARQKLATLPRNRFKDLASDVFFELRRRYPEFEEEMEAEEEEDREKLYDEPPPAPGPRHPFAAGGHSNNPSQSSLQQPDRQRVTPTPPPMNRLNSAQSGHRRQTSRNISGGSSVGSSAVPAHRQRPSRDETGGPGPQRPNPTATTSDMVVPTKSRMREEEIEVPYARDSQIMDEPRSQSRASSRPESRSSYQNERRTPLGARQLSTDVLTPATPDDREYYDRMSFSSNVTSKSKPGPTGWDDEREQKIRSEYELKIAGLERRLAAAESERDETRRSEPFEAERRRELEDEIRGLKERANTHASSLRSLQHELDIARDAAEAARSHGEERSKGAEQEVDHWRERCESLEDELRRQEESNAQGHDRGSGSGGNDDEAVRELRNEIHSLVDELNALSTRNDELMAEREQDAERMNDMEAKVQEYKRKFDAIRIELRNLKATSTMFVSKPLSDDHLPASADGNIEDVHVSSFQTAIDGLLTSARSSAPSSVLPAMKAVVEAVTEIGEDVKAFEAKPNLDVDVSRLESLKHESSARLNTLMQAARNHAMASGLSPVSLLDAAAGHLTSNVIEIIKLLKIKRSDKNRELRRSRSSMSIKDMVNRSNSNPNLARDVGKANGDWDREYGPGNPVLQSNQTNNEERLRESPAFNERRPSPAPAPAPALAAINTQPQQPYQSISSPSELTPASANNYFASNNGNTNNNNRLNGGGPAPSMDRQNSHQPFRVNSYQSVTSQKSDSFDLERKASVSSNRTGNDPRAMVESRIPIPTANGGNLGPGGYNGNGPSSASRVSPMPVNEKPMSPTGMPYERTPSGSSGYRQSPIPQPAPEPEADGADEREWEDLKPYLNAQSSALVNSIQNLLAAIRTSSGPPVLNEHLSEVIAIASSIVAVSTNALPASLRAEGDGLLRELVKDTDRLSEAQGTGVNTGDKGIRQQIASASFGVAKSLKALMKLGSE